MYYNTITEAKKAYKEAYSWGIKVQKACILKPVDIDVACSFCESNYREDNIDAWSVDINIYDAKSSMFVKAEWTAWDEPEKFEEGKKAVLAYLAGKGINIK